MKHRQHSLWLADVAEGLAHDHRLAVRGRQLIRDVPSTPLDPPRVTVMLLAYNYGHFLEQSADSALRQNGVDVELLIVDDASTDATPQVTERLADRDPRVRVLRNKTNMGHLPSVNLALDTVETKYVVKLDADDLLAPGSLARAAALMESHSNVAFVYGQVVYFTGDVPLHDESPTSTWTIWEGRSWFARRCRSGTNVILQPEVLMRTDAVRRVGPIREYLPHTSDMHLWMQLASIGDVGRVNGPTQGYYRIHDQSMQRTVHSGVLFDLQRRRDAFESVFVAEAADLSNADSLHDRARRALAASALDWASRAYDEGRSDDEPVDELISFAVETWPQAPRLAEWVGLHQRVEAGPDVVPRHFRFRADAAARRAADAVGHRRWQRTGER